MKESGKVHYVGEIQQVGDQYQKQVVVIVKQGQKSDQFFAFELFGRLGDDSFDQIPALGRMVEVEFWIRCNPGKGSSAGRWFTSLVPKAINYLSDEPPTDHRQTDDRPPTDLAAESNFGRKTPSFEDTDDIPF